MVIGVIMEQKVQNEKNMKEILGVLTRLEKVDCRLSTTRIEFFRTKIEWIGHKINQAGIRPLQYKLLAIKKQ